MIRAFVENPRLMILTIAVLLVAGLGALSSLPRSEDPRLTPRFAMVFTPFPVQVLSESRRWSPKS